MARSLEGSIRAGITTVLRYRIQTAGDMPVRMSRHEMRELMEAVGQKELATRYDEVGNDQRTFWEVEAFVLEALVRIAEKRKHAQVHQN